MLASEPKVWLCPTCLFGPYGRFGRLVVGGADLSNNVFSADPILGRNNTYGSAWGTPTRFLDGRLAKLGVQLTF